MIWIRFIRKSKDPHKLCQSSKALFEKAFTSPEEAIRWLKRAHRSVYIWDASLSREEDAAFNKKLFAAIPDYESYNEAYFRMYYPKFYETAKEEDQYETLA